MESSNMQGEFDRVRQSTSDDVNAEIDRETDANIARYSSLSHPEILSRIRRLDQEWDIERVLQVNASTLALAGLTLGVFVNKKWLGFSAGVMAFLLQHGIQGWCPPLPILRRMGIRTRGEIDQEKFALTRQLSITERS
jgi:hypothetical protein